MIRFGDQECILGLKKLWKECFADEDAYINSFFESLYQKEQVLLAEENGALMGASFFLPGKIYLEHPQTGGYWQNIRYVYALAVYPRFRGHGIAGNLLKEAYQRYQAPLLAEPAEEGLVDGFYKPLGFSKEFYLKKRKIKLFQYDLQAAQVSPRLKLYQADADIYCRIRDRQFQRNGYVSWPKEHVAFAIAEHRANGGDALVAAGEGREDILLYYTEDGQAVVTETTLSEKEAAEVLNAALKQPCSTALLIQDISVKEEADGLQIPYGADCCLTGVSFGISGIKGYLNITLD